MEKKRRRKRRRKERTKKALFFRCGYKYFALKPFN
jgi:hypothetical protein